MTSTRQSCTVADPRACNHATFTDTHATPHATPMQPGSLKALAGKVLRRNSPCNSDATQAEKPCNFSPEKLPKKLHRVAPKNGPGWNLVAAMEIMDLVRDKRILLVRTPGGGLHPGMPRGAGWSAADWCFVMGIWCEGFEHAFRWQEVRPC